MQTEIDLPLTHTHKKNKSFDVDDFETIDVDKKNKKPEKKKDNLVPIPETEVPVRSNDKMIKPAAVTLQPAQQHLTLPSPSDQALSSIQNQTKSISNNLQTILSHYKQINDNEFLFSGHSPKKQQEIKQFLTRLKKEKKERRDRISQSVQVTRKDDSPTSEEIIQRKKRIEERFNRKIKTLEQAHQKRQQQHNKFKQFYKQYKNSKPYYIQKQEQEQKLAEKQEMEFQAALNHNAKKYKPISEDQFKQHTQRYEQALREFEQAKQYQRQQYQQRIAEENEKLQEIWKGNFHQMLQKERYEKKKQKEHPKEMRKKIQDYAKEIKQNYFPKSQRKYVDGSVRERFEAGSTEKKPKTHRVLKRFKYVNGQAMGAVEEKLPLQISEKEKRSIGNNYLQMVKAMPKKKQQPSIQTTPPQPIVKPKKQSVPRQARVANPLYDVNRSLSLSANPDRHQLQQAIYQLKNYDSKINQEQKILKLQKLPSVVEYQERQRMINMKLVKGIEEKLNLLAQM